MAKKRVCSQFGCEKRAFVVFLHDTAEGDWVCVVLGELLTADVQRIESVGTVSTMLKQVLLGLRLLLHRLSPPL